MIVIHVSVKARAGLADAFERTLSSVVADAGQSPGCARYEWYRAAEPQPRYVIYGEFESAAAFRLYLDSPAVRRIGAELRPLLAAEPEFAHFEATMVEGNR